MKIGVDYYPKHWDAELWEKDADLMRETGVSIVRMAEFAWCRLEPREGEFDFVWLDRAISLFADRKSTWYCVHRQAVRRFGCTKSIRMPFRQERTAIKSQRESAVIVATIILIFCGMRTESLK